MCDSSPPVPSTSLQMLSAGEAELPLHHPIVIFHSCPSSESAGSRYPCLDMPRVGLPAPGEQGNPPHPGLQMQNSPSERGVNVPDMVNPSV